MTRVTLKREVGLNGYEIHASGARVGTIYYDRPSRCWWAFLIDADGNQTGRGEDAYDKEGALAALGFIL